MKKLLNLISLSALILMIFSKAIFANDNEIRHVQEYQLSDQTKRNEKIKNQPLDDLEGCPILVKMGQWEYIDSINKSSDKKKIWTREQSWMYPDGIISEIGTGIKGDDFTYPKEILMIYVGPWKDIHLEYGLLWNKTKLDKKIRFTAFQKKNDAHKGYIYGSYEFMTPENQNIPEQPIKLAKNLPTPDFVTFCKVKWVAKHGYNGVFDTKAGKMIEAKE